MRKSFLAFLPALLLASCGGEETKPVTEISLDELPNGLDVGEQIDLDEESGLTGVSWKIDDGLGKVGEALIKAELNNIPKEKVRGICEDYIGKIEQGERDFRF